MTASKSFLYVSFLILGAGCATTPKQKILRDMAIAGVVGAVLGQQANSNKDAYSLMYGGVLSASAAVTGLFVYDPGKDAKKYREEAEKLKKQLEEVFSPKLETQTPGTLGGRVPGKYKNMISPGEWRIYAIDQWVEEGENRLIHQDKIMELIPPALRPIQNPISKKGASRE